jgi:hypothetical protein
VREQESGGVRRRWEKGGKVSIEQTVGVFEPPNKVYLTPHPQPRRRRTLRGKQWHMTLVVVDDVFAAFVTIQATPPPSQLRVANDLPLARHQRLPRLEGVPSLARLSTDSQRTKQPEPAIMIA